MSQAHAKQTEETPCQVIRGITCCPFRVAILSPLFQCFCAQSLFYPMDCDNSASLLPCLYATLLLLRTCFCGNLPLFTVAHGLYGLSFVSCFLDVYGLLSYLPEDTVLSYLPEDKLCVYLVPLDPCVAGSLCFVKINSSVETLSTLELDGRRTDLPLTKGKGVLCFSLNRVPPFPDVSLSQFSSRLKEMV